MKRKSGLSFYQKERKINKNFWKGLLGFVFWGLVMVLIAFTFVYLFGVRTSVIGPSMEPTLSNGQEVLIDRFSYYVTTPSTGDVVVFLPNGNENFHYYVKRIIGVPGDTVLIKDGIVYINGEMLESRYVMDMVEDGGIASSGITLGEDEYFVLGDNRNNSEDSRSSNIGIVMSDYIIGKVWFHLSCNGSEPGFVK